MKSYKRRWVVLRGTELQWYESERQPTPQGTMELVPGNHVVVDTPGDIKFEIHPKDPKERAYFFKVGKSWSTRLFVFKKELFLYICRASLLETRSDGSVFSESFWILDRLLALPQLMVPTVRKIYLQFLLVLHLM